MKDLLFVLEAILGVLVIASILMQKSKADALSGLIQGSKSESFFAKNKSKTKESILVKITVISMFFFMVNTVLLNMV